MSAPRRVVITGLGVTSPFGVGPAALADGLSAGRDGFAPLEGRLGALPPGVGAKLDLPRKEFKLWFDTRVLRLSTMTRQTQLGCIAAGDLLKSLDMVPDGSKHLDRGAFLGSFIVPPDFAKQVRAIRILSHRPEGEETGFVLDDGRLAEAMKFASAFDFLRALPNMPSSHLSIQTGYQGPACTYLGSDASGMQAIGMAVQVIRSGQATAMIAGAAFSPFQEVHLAWQHKRGLWNTDEGAGGDRVRPYSTQAGSLPGEGGAVFYLEEREMAEARGATILAEITGYGQRMIIPDAAGQADVRAEALRAALPDGTPDWVAPSGLGRPDMDRLDDEAHRLAFGAQSAPAVVAVTPHIGFSGPATGPLGLAAALLTGRGDATPARITVDADPGCATLAGGLARAGRTGAGATAVASSFTVDGVHAAIGVRIEA
ncbi:MAG: beta-ketoacyl synthase [Deltaproteobacteria bacterium]|nr:beta-ketoacyl synthase [Deltaproteobacteria bacterium]